MDISINRARVFPRAGGGDLISIEQLHISGKRIGIVGPSGSGKSTFLNLIGGAVDLLPLNWEGEIEIQGKRIDELSAEERRRYLSTVFTRIYPEPSYMLCAGKRIKRNMKILLARKEHKAFFDLLSEIDLDYKGIRNKFPEQLSGGQRQWTGMAIGLARGERVLLLDEPTTSLQESTREKLARFLRPSYREFIVVTHDRAFLRELGVEVIYRMDGGRIGKEDPDNPGELGNVQHDRDRGADKADNASGETGTTLVLETSELSQGYYVRTGLIPRKREVLRGLSLSFGEGSTALVEGDNGSGKTTLFKSILRVLNDTEGRILFRHRGGEEIDLVKANRHGYRSDTRRMRSLRDRLQWVCQESGDAFDPAMSFRKGFEQIAKAIGDSRYLETIRGLLSVFGLPEEVLSRKPSSASSGERKRLDLIRALAMDPDILMLDEPFNHLDSGNTGILRNLLLNRIGRRRLLLVSTHVNKDIIDFDLIVPVRRKDTREL